MSLTNRQDGAAAVIRSALSSDLAPARSLIEGDPQLATFDFYTACVTGEAEAVEAQLQRDPALVTRKGGPLDREPLLYACFSRFLRGDRRRAEGIVRIASALLVRGADPNSHYVVEEGGNRCVQTALFGAAGVANDARLTQMLLKAGADVNELAGDPAPGDSHGLGTESLYHASEFSDTTCLRLLLGAGPHPLRISYCFARALDFANPAAALLYLAHGADPNFRVPWMHNRTHLQRAVMNGRPTEVVEAMIARGGDVNASDDRDMTPFRYAVRFGHLELAELLSQHGASTVGVTDVDRALGACVVGTPPGNVPIGGDGADVLCRAAQLGDAGAVARLLDAGVPADVAGGMDGTPALHWACWRGHLDAARVFVERGASLTQVNRYGGTALGTTIHGSFNCHDVEGGPSMRLDEEVTHGDYPGLVAMLIGAGAPLPPVIRGGSPAVRAVLRRHGVPDAAA